MAGSESRSGHDPVWGGGGCRRDLWMLIARVDEPGEDPLFRPLAFPVSSGWAGKKHI